MPSFKTFSRYFFKKVPFDNERLEILFYPVPAKMRGNLPRLLLPSFALDKKKILDNPSLLKNEYGIFNPK